MVNYSMTTKATTEAKEKKISLNYPGAGDDSRHILLGLKSRKTFKYWDLDTHTSVLSFSYHVTDVANIHRMTAEHVKAHSADFNGYIYDPSEQLKRILPDAKQKSRFPREFPKMVEAILADTSVTAVVLINNADEILGDDESLSALKKLLKAEHVRVHATVHGNKIINSDLFNDDKITLFSAVAVVGYLVGREYTRLFKDEAVEKSMRTVVNNTVGWLNVASKKVSTYDLLKVTHEWRPKTAQKTDTV